MQETVTISLEKYEYFKRLEDDLEELVRGSYVLEVDYRNKLTLYTDDKEISERFADYRDKHEKGLNKLANQFSNKEHELNNKIKRLKVDYEFQRDANVKQQLIFENERQDLQGRIRKGNFWFVMLCVISLLIGTILGYQIAGI